jgi:hypothetical protein
MKRAPIKDRQTILARRFILDPLKKRIPLPKEGYSSWRLGVLTCLAKTGAVAGLFAFSDYFSDYIFEEISRSEIEDVGGSNGWS